MKVRGANGHRKTLAERMEEHTQKSEGNGCWLWMAARKKGKLNYGYVSIGGHKVKQAHRMAWELEYGPIPEGKCVLHSCDNPPCVRPSHLFLGDELANARDRDRKGRGRPRGSEERGKSAQRRVVSEKRQMAALG